MLTFQGNQINEAHPPVLLQLNAPIPSIPWQLFHEDRKIDTSGTGSTNIEETSDDLSNEICEFDPTRFLHDNSFLDIIDGRYDATIHGENLFGSMEETPKSPSVRIRKS